ncbi:NAD(+) diphosphatase [Litorimonas sp. RW-G-Af-16]|uniref:NAD(+) diphosphatase n=1 Tax=Litorimonas sp. RW-G-Af-16 TaxID=3241168 RepID=UPI00390CA050
MTYTPSPMPFAGNTIDYAEVQRTPQHLQTFLGQSNARTILLFEGKVGIGKGGRLHRTHPSDLIGQNLFEPGPIFLGMEGERPIFAASLQKPETFLPIENFVDLRLGGGQLDPVDLATAGRAKSLFDWHKTHRFCANCGGGSISDEGGAKRRCNHCETDHFPRVNPVAIMLVQKDDMVLLGRGPGWPEGFMSCLAGFVSPGETVEEATYREVLEEVGVKTHNHRYVFSQPWPFPSQLMMGMICDAANTKITLNVKELEDAQWFTRAQVEAVFDKSVPNDAKPFMRPPRTTIAHQMLRYWLTQ